METDKKIAVLVPCFNEEVTIAKVVKDIRAVLPRAEVYVYDNNSTDRTIELAREAGAHVRSEYRQGKGNVLRSMFAQIEADVYLLLDGDDTYPVESAVAMIEPVLEGRADMVVGDRLSTTYFNENKRPMHNSGNRLVRRIINVLFNAGINDVMSGFRAFSVDFVKNFPIESKGFEIETEMTIHALDKNFRVKEIPVTYKDRPVNSVSKLNTFSDGYKVLKTIAILFRDYRPFTFFAVIAAILAVTGIVLFIPLLSEYFRTGLVPRFPTLILTCGIFIVSALAFTCGIILGALARSNRRNYEYDYLRWRTRNQ